MAQNVTVVHVPQVRQASFVLQRMARVVGSGKLSGPPSWKLAATISREAALQGSIGVFLFCSTIFGHWRQLLLFCVRQVSMFPRCCCCVLGEKPRRSLTHYLPLDHSEAVFLVDLDSGQ